MSIKVISGIAGSLTAVGAGIGIYLFNNSKSDTNNPPIKPAKSWTEIISSPEYIQAKKTGQTLNFTTYSSAETADNESNYFLMETTNITGLDNTNKTIKEGIIFVNNGGIFEFTIEKNLSDFPFFCFNDSSLSQIEKLNFNTLKKCETNNSQNKYMVIFLGNYDGLKTSHTSLTKKFNEWHDKNYVVKIDLTTTDSKKIIFEGKMLKIFRKEYTPTTSS